MEEEVINGGDGWMKITVNPLLPNIDQLQHEVSSLISNFEGGATPKSLTQVTSQQVSSLLKTGCTALF
jgi:hypothetical protein